VSAIEPRGSRKRRLSVSSKQTWWDTKGNKTSQDIKNTFLLVPSEELHMGIFPWDHQVFLMPPSTYNYKFHVTEIYSFTNLKVQPVTNSNTEMVRLI